MAVYGFNESMEALRLPTGSRSAGFNKDIKLINKLILAGDDHAKAIRGIVVWAKVRMQTGFMIELDTYRMGVECLSTSSSMHQELRGLKGEALAEKKQADLVEKVYTRISTYSYQALRNIYIARRHHRHPDWDIFCKWIERLPRFKDCIYPEVQQKVSKL